MKQAVILAGGFGTRLAAAYGDIPKPMVPLMGRPVIDHIIKLCRRHGFEDILVLAHYRWEVIRDHVDPDVHVHVETTPMGTAGALHDALNLLADRFVLLYGDTYADVNLTRLWEEHISSGADATLLTHPNSHPYDSDLLEVDSAGWVKYIHSYPHQVEIRNLANAALCVLEKKLLESICLGAYKCPDIAKHLFPAALKEGLKLRSYRSVEYVKDMGTPDRLLRVESDITNGVPERLSGRIKRRAVFLDRDGTLNQECGLIRSPDMLSLIPGAAEAVRRLNESGWLCIVVTNQPVIARGEITEKQLDQIHSRLDFELGLKGAYVDEIRFCPHHPDSGYSNEIPALKIKCFCRKPEPGLLVNAILDYGIDPSNSWMIGDATTDIEAGRRAGLKTILVGTGRAGVDGISSVKPDFTLKDVGDAIDFILSKYHR
jgi:histidinol-phosphate phosphatase family protein